MKSGKPKTPYNPYEADPNLMKFVQSITTHLGYDFDKENIKKLTQALQKNMDDEIDRLIPYI